MGGLEDLILGDVLLRRAENVSIGYVNKIFSKSYMQIRIGRQSYRLTPVSYGEYTSGLSDQRTHPWLLCRIGERIYWHFEDRFYWTNEDLSSHQVRALLVSKRQQNQSRIERAEARVAAGVRPRRQEGRRDVIPDDVKQSVWVRDGGRCRHCGARTELQFDHVIPVSLGGSSQAQNLQILCGPCNRRKGAGLTVR